MPATRAPNIGATPMNAANPVSANSTTSWKATGLLRWITLPRHEARRATKAGPSSSGMRKNARVTTTWYA